MLVKSTNSVYAADLGSYTENVRIRHSWAAVLLNSVMRQNEKEKKKS